MFANPSKQNFSDKESPHQTLQRVRKNAGTADHAQERDPDNFSWLHVWRSPSGRALS
jgi:hypothetical protein